MGKVCFTKYNKCSLAILEPLSRIGGWGVDEKLRMLLEDLGLRDVRFHPFVVNYPKGGMSI